MKAAITTKYEKKWHEMYKNETSNTRKSYSTVDDFSSFAEKHQLSYHLNSIFTGHGPFKANLYRFKNCQTDQDPHHVYLECPSYKHLTKELEMKAVLLGIGAWDPSSIRSLLHGNITCSELISASRAVIHKLEFENGQIQQQAASTHPNN